MFKHAAFDFDRGHDRITTGTIAPPRDGDEVFTGVEPAGPAEGALIEPLAATPECQSHGQGDFEGNILHRNLGREGELDDCDFRGRYAEAG